MRAKDYIVRTGTLIARESTCAAKPGRAVQVCLKRSSRGRLVEKPVTTPDSACDAFRFLASRDRESFVVAHLGPQRQVQGVEEVARGSVSEVSVHPREVFKGAILSNAHAIIVGHNHPSGDATPSHPDRQISQRLVAVGKLIGMPVLDHVVIGANECVSMREKNPEDFE